MALEKYRAKRNFKVTPEPRGGKLRAGEHELVFVIQKHAASHLHYDFRLELNGVLLSWAVPKGPSLDPGDRRLALHVEDHPIEYGAFEGIIPAHQYGAGTVMLWDRGTWHPTGDPVEGYAKGHLKFELDGEKLHGGWDLIRTRSAKYGGNGGDKAWLLIKENDAHARAGKTSIVDSAPDSVTTGRSLEKIAAARSHVWESKRSVAENVRAGAIAGVDSAAASKGTAKRPARRLQVRGPQVAGKANTGLPDGAKPAKLPALLAPTLATLVSTAPTGDDWVHEVKYDGYRIVARIDKGEARLYTRNGKDWTGVFPTVAADLARLPLRNAWIDGEVVVLDASGRPSFQGLQNALTGKGTPVSFFAFDLIYRDGYDLRGVALTERKQLLRDAIGKGIGIVRVGPDVRGHGDEFFRQACSLSLEGAVSKRADSLYRDGVRTRDWVKVKCTRRQEMVIGGYTEPRGARTGFGALLLGFQQDGELRYAGKVGTGFDGGTLEKLYKLLVKREQDHPPFANPPRGHEARGAHWVKPDLVAEIAFTEWSNDGALRHPSFQGLRVDKTASEVVREEPGVPTAASAQQESGTPPTAKGRGGPAAKRDQAAKAAAPAKARSAKAAPSSRKAEAVVAKGASSGKAEAVVVAGIAISNPQKLYFPEAGITKVDVARYYERIAPWLLPHLKDRPLSLVRCPDGWKGQCFYQKHADKAVNPAVDRIEVPEGSGTATYMGARSPKAVVALLQWGVVEMHPWGSRRPRLERPDRLIFDLDPDDGIGWKDLVTGVELVRKLLRELELEAFLKTTGGKGLHVVVPIRPTLGWEPAKAFTRAVAEFLVRTFEDRFIATASKAKRRGKIFIDYLRNAEGATAIAPYGVRARKGAPVAMPLAWDDLGSDVRFDHFNVRTAVDFLERRKQDPWADFLTTKQAINKAHAKRVGATL